MQNEPFPSSTNVPYKTLVWEAINKNGSGCDYVSESIIRDAEMKDGCLCYGPRKYKTLFMIEVERMEPATARKLYDFVACGGRIFCIEAYPHLSVGLTDHVKHDKEVQDWVEKMKQIWDTFSEAATAEEPEIRQALLENATTMASELHNMTTPQTDLEDGRVFMSMDELRAELDDVAQVIAPQSDEPQFG